MSWLLSVVKCPLAKILALLVQINTRSIASCLCTHAAWSHLNHMLLSLLKISACPGNPGWECLGGHVGQLGDARVLLELAALTAQPDSFAFGKYLLGCHSGISFSAVCLIPYTS
jgi:hypothetical protein